MLNYHQLNFQQLDFYCHAVTTKYPDLKFTGLCHEIASMERQLPTIMETDFSNIEIKAGGLNHFSILLEAK